MTNSSDLTLAQVVAAYDRIAPYVHRTPVLTSRTLDERTGRRVFLKAENFQRGGSFKVRGATNRLAALPPEVRARGVVAFSSGNHAQGVALAARTFGVPATLVMPTDAPVAKIAAARSYGARIVYYDRHRDDREAVAQRLAEELDAVVVPPYDHYDVIAGQGTAALELLMESAGLTHCSSRSAVADCSADAPLSQRLGIRQWPFTGLRPNAPMIPTSPFALDAESPLRRRKPSPTACAT